MAFVWSGFRLISSMAAAVGRINSSILRRLASAFTLSIDRQGAGTGADDQATTLPGNVFLQ